MHWPTEQSANVVVIARAPTGLRVLVGLLYAVVLYVISYDAYIGATRTTVLQVGLATGLTAGAAAAVNEVNLAISKQYLLVRNPFFVRRIPWSSIEESEINKGLDITLTNRRYPITLSASSSLIALSRSRPEAIKAVIDMHVASAREHPSDSTELRPETRPKLSWLVIVPTSTAALVLYAWFAASVFR
jgi:hypothetical protein